MKDETRKQLDPKEVGAILGECTPDTLEQLQGFAGFILDETHGRTALLDQKGVAILGWSSTFLVFLLFTVTRDAADVNRTAVILTQVGAVFAGIAVLLSFLALRIRDWRVPSERDWFHEAYYDEPKTLKAFHLQELLRFQQNARKINDSKSFWGFWAQGALAVAAIVAAAAVLVTLTA